LLLAAETERAFADSGHSLDFINKAFECLDLIGWEHAPALLPTVVGQMVAARGAEESTAWRQPVDLVALCDESAKQLPDLLAAHSAEGWTDHMTLADGTVRLYRVQRKADCSTVFSSFFRPRQICQPQAFSKTVSIVLILSFRAPRRS
jgi:hypothetical protein